MIPEYVKWGAALESGLEVVGGVLLVAATPALAIQIVGVLLAVCGPVRFGLLLYVLSKEPKR